MSRLKFPLPKETLHEMHVSDKQIRSYEAQVFDLVDEALQEYERFEVQGAALYKQPWKTSAKSDIMKVVKMKDALLPMRIHYRVFGTIEGDFRHVMEFMYAETTEDFKQWQQIMFPTVVDASVAATFRSATPDKPHHSMGLRWIVCHPVPWEWLFTSYVEYTAYMKDSTGRAIGVRVNIPADVPQLSMLMSGMNVKRFDHTIVQLLVPSRSQHCHTNIFNVIQHDHPSYVPFVFDKSLLVMAERMASFATSRRIVKTGLLPQEKWAPDASRRACYVCRRVFGTRRGRHHCRMCGEVICRMCVMKQDTPQPKAAERGIKMKKAKFCVLCITSLRDRPANMLPSIVHSAVTSASSSRWSGTGSGSGSLLEDDRSEPARSLREFQQGGVGMMMDMRPAGSSAPFSHRSLPECAFDVVTETSSFSKLQQEPKTDLPRGSMSFGSEQSSARRRRRASVPPRDSFDSISEDTAPFYWPSRQHQQPPHRNTADRQAATAAPPQVQTEQRSAVPTEAREPRAGSAASASSSAGTSTMHAVVQATRAHVEIERRLAEQAELLRRMVLHNTV